MGDKSGKLQMKTEDLAHSNLATLQALFPNAVTETIDEDGKVVRAIDADALAQEINTHVVSGKEERYQFTWPDKAKAKLAANAPIRATLRPCREESKDFDNTENLYIEGDNLDVLKLLRETYLGKVKMIYIDPPYNTGNDFVYNDNYKVDSDQWDEMSGDYDQDGNRMVKNLDSNGRFHTDWLNMIYPRLRVARDLLRDDGVIFISIDDNEVENLKKICNEVFGEGNFVAGIVWQKKTSPDARMDISAAHDFIIIYAKHRNDSTYLLNTIAYDEERLKNFKNPDNDPRGVWASVDVTGQTGRAPKSQFYEITSPSGKKYLPPEGRCWAMAEKTFYELYADNRLWFGENGNNRPRVKKFLSESDGVRPWTWWDNKFASHNQEGNQELMELFDGKLIFDNPKPTMLLKRIIELATKKDEPCLCLDFFSGSGSLGEAVMRLNAHDGGKRRFILIQIPQVLSDKGNDFKANNVATLLGFTNLCDIGKERIRRAGEKIVARSVVSDQWPVDSDERLLDMGEEGSNQCDTGFRVLKLDSSNMKDVFYTPQEYAPLIRNLDDLVDNIKEDRTAEDLLFQVMLDLGIPLSAKLDTRQIDGVTVHYVEGDYLAACFDAVTDGIVTKIAQSRPKYAVFRDSSFASDNTLVNFEQIFMTYSPETIRKVL
ncbi:MAG: site-specific DNA-methyltransferase [Holophagaceae bacterium]|nr:site-specific DNA-methyltransferase [Holophagaceae bacterium]